MSGHGTGGRMPPIQGTNITWDNDEWRTQGQSIFLVTSYYRCTSDRDTLRDWYPDARAAARFIAELRTSQIDAQGPARWLAGRCGCFSQAGTRTPARC